LNIIASYSFNDSMVTQSNSDNLGMVPLYIPQNMAAVWSDYTIQSGSLAGLNFGGGVRYVGSTFGNTQNTLEVPAYTLVDATVSYDLGYLDPDLAGWKAAVNATNLLDNVYVSECSNESYCLYGLRRTVLATLRYNW